MYHLPSHRMSSLYLQYMCFIFDRYTTTEPHPLSAWIFRYHYSVAFNEHKGEYHCTIYFIIAAVNIVSSLTVPYYFSLFHIYHKVIFCVRIIALFSILTHIFTNFLSLLQALHYYTFLYTLLINWPDYLTQR